jgi:putative ABC transport system permease protein
MSVSEQKATIQIWRASGASRGLIKRLYVLQAVILSVIGASIGAAIGYIVCRLINNRIETVLSAQGLSSLQLPNVPLWIIAGGIMITVGLAMLAAIYPAHVAARKIVD